MSPSGRRSVFSVQSASLGNAVYSQTLRTHFAGDPRLDVRAAWVGDDRTLPERVLYRLMDAHLPGAAIARHNLDLRRVRNEAASGLLARGLVGRHVRAHGLPDVLHFHTQVPALMSLGWMRRIPTVLTTDASAVNHRAIDPLPDWTHAPSVALDRRVFRAAARAVFFSAWARDSVQEPYGLDPSRVRIIPPGVATERFAVPDRDATRRLPRLLFVGNRVASKGGNDVLDVFVRELAGRAELHVATNDRLPEMPPGVTVHRGVQAYTPEWFALYDDADVFVLPTRVDAFGLVFIEAMAAGLPVVATRLNAVPEIVADGETGLLVPPGDRDALARALTTLVDSSDLRRRFGTAGRRRAEAHFDMRTNLDRLGACFLEASETGVPPRAASPA